MEITNTDIKLEGDDVYERLGLPFPSVAFQRSRINADSYSKGRWRSTWWMHRIEPLAAERAGISNLKGVVTAYSRDMFMRAYAELAASLDVTEQLHVEVCPDSLTRQLSQAQQIVRLQKLKRDTQLWG